MNKARLLVVEDEGITAMDTSDYLHSVGYEVCATAFSGQEAIDLATQCRPDLVLMDIRLQGKMDGIEAAQQIRSRLDIPVIYVTAHADDLTLQRAKLSQPVGYVLKPFEERTLCSTIELGLYQHKVEQQRAEFLSMLSHDIRNPLGAMLGYIEFLGEAIERQERNEATDLLQRLTGLTFRMHSLVTNYLDFSRINTGQVLLHQKPLQLNELLQQVTRSYEAEVRRQQLSLELQLQETIPLIMADKVALERVFTNLLSNAIKFTPTGGQITLRSRQHLDQVLVTMHNTGLGIPPEEIPWLFQRYHRVSTTAQSDGTGLGLFIVRTFVEAHGGQVEVHTAPDQGVTFSVALPL